VVVLNKNAGGEVAAGDQPRIRDGIAVVRKNAGRGKAAARRRPHLYGAEIADDVVVLHGNSECAETGGIADRDDSAGGVRDRVVVSTGNAGAAQAHADRAAVGDGVAVSDLNAESKIAW